MSQTTIRSQIPKSVDLFKLSEALKPVCELLNITPNDIGRRVFIDAAAVLINVYEEDEDELASPGYPVLVRVVS